MISVVIPVRNEGQLQRGVDEIRLRASGAEILVVDTSCEPAEILSGVRYLHRPDLTTRSEALNEGARIAAGNLLWFLHSDCLPPDGSVGRIESLHREGVRAGAFSKKYDARTKFLQIQERFLNISARRFARLLAGTNGLFVDRDLFEEVGRFPILPLFEDVVMFDRLRRRGDFRVISETLTVSARRYSEGGYLNRFSRNALLYTAFRLGRRAEDLVRWY